MASVKYFNGETELFFPFGLDNAKFTAKFGIKGRKYDSFRRMVAFPAGVRGDDNAIPVERVITFKSNPSLHVCDARCMNAKGFNCECSCGGKNHGRGFTCT